MLTTIKFTLCTSIRYCKPFLRSAVIQKPAALFYSSLQLKMSSNSDSDFDGVDGEFITPEKKPSAPTASKKKPLSVERIYQKKTQLEHILLRPDTYVGSIESVTQSMWVFDHESQSMIQKEITYVPGLYKIFDEILVNAADNKQRDKNMSTIRIDIKRDEGMIKIWNNGQGIPVVTHKDEKIFVPTLIFGHLLTSSNYNDEELKVTGGRNGYGAKLCNIFSKKFVVETSSREYRKCFKQTWLNNMTKSSDPQIKESDGDDYTSVSFWPDLPRFGMESLNQDIYELFSRRAYDVAATTEGVKVFLNGKKLPIKGFKDYVEFYLKNKTDDSGNSLKLVYENCGPRWEVAVALSSSGFQQVSFVNSIATTKGGRHVDHVTEQVVSKLAEVIKKKSGAKSGVAIKPFQIKNHLWMFVRSLIVNPSFDSQTKENMTTLIKNFGSRCALSDKFNNAAAKCGITDSVLSWMRFKAQEKLDKQCHKSKHTKLKGIPKLDDANDAGTKNSTHCTLILTEGDSAKSLAVAGLGVIGRDRYGVFPLRGKVLNVREATSKQIMENAEITALVKIMGLQYKNKYSEPEALKTLRYGKIMIMTDQDQDGSHIKGLLINFIHHNWPQLLKNNFLEQFITPIVKVSKGKHELSFYSLPEFEEWKSNTNNWHTWRIKYYKGLGTSTSKEAKEYFSDMARHRIRFRYGGTDDDKALTLAFGKKEADARKNWLTEWMEDRRQRSELGLPEEYLYGKNTSNVTYSEFVNRELILFSNMDNERSIPSLIDGLKPGQRKVLYTCFKRNQLKEVKVAQLAGSVAEHSAYHHGEQSLMGTIINLAQNFVGSNNLNLLQPRGQFGTRLNGGKDAASPRYIFTCLSPLARLVFHPADDPLLKSQYDDNLRIEPVYYVPVIPMVLINGAEGIGTGWSTKVPTYDVREIVQLLRDRISGRVDADRKVDILPSFRGFKGEVTKLEDNRYVVHGEVSVLDNDGAVDITELPVRTWTQAYKESVLEVMLNGSDKVQPIIQDYKEYHTDTTVRFVVRMNPDKLNEAELQGLHKFFKLSTALTTNSMVLFDKDGCIKKFSDISDILSQFYHVRLDLYVKRKNYLIGMLAAESLKLENQARFVLEKIENKIKVEGRKKKEMVELLKSKNYDPDPVRAWKLCQDQLNALQEEVEMREQRVDAESESEEDAVAGESAEVKKAGQEYDYIMKMPMWSLTTEQVEKLCKQRDAKKEELNILRRKSPEHLWLEDLDALMEGLEKLEKEEAEENKKPKKEIAKKITAGGRIAKLKVNETLPSPDGRRITPKVDSALRLKLDKEKRAKAKKAQTAAQRHIMEDFLGLNDSDDDIKPLTERLSAGGVTVSPDITTSKKAATASRRGRGRGGGTTGAGRGRGKPAEGSPKKAKKKKKNPWESGSSNSSDDQSSEDNTDDDLVPLRERVAPRRAAAVVKKYALDSSDAESKDSEVVFHDVDHGETNHEVKPIKEDSDEDFGPALSDKDEDEGDEPPPRPPPTLKPKVQKRKLLPPVPPPSKKQKAEPSTRGRGRGRGGAARGAGTKKKRKKSWNSDSESPDLSSGDDFQPAPLKDRVPAKRRAAATVRKYVESSGDESLSDVAPMKVNGNSKKPARDFFNSSDSEDDVVATKSRPAALDSSPEAAGAVNNFEEDSD